MNIQEDMRRGERTYDEEIHKRINYLLRERTRVQMERSEDAIRIE